MEVIYYTYCPFKNPSIHIRWNQWSWKFSCLNVFISRTMKANTFFSSSLICARPPRSLHLDSHPRVSGIILKQQPDSRADKGQQRASGEPANSLSLSPACLSNRSMWAQGHLVFNLSLAPCALFNLCLSLGAPWSTELLRRVSGKWGGEVRCRAWCLSTLTELD